MDVFFIREIDSKITNSMKKRYSDAPGVFTFNIYGLTQLFPMYCMLWLFIIYYFLGVKIHSK